MKLKQDATLDVVCEKLRKEISTHITVKIKTHPIYRNRWIEVNKDSFVGVKIFHKENDLLIDGHIPSFFARAFFGSLISSLFHYRARKNFKQEIIDFLISEFFEE